MSIVTQKRKLAEAELRKNAKLKFMSLDRFVYSELAKNRDHLQRYILSKKETPLPELKQLIVQAALLRYTEINHVAQLNNTTEEQSLLIVESSEAEKIYNNSSDYILPSNISAALNIILEQKKGTKLKEVGSLLNRSKKFNGFTVTDSEPWLGGSDPQPTSDYGSVSTADKVGDWAEAAGSIFDTFNKVVDGINKAKSTATSTINDVGGAVQTQLDKFSGIASDVGSDSITKSLKENLPTILVIIAVIVLIIVMAVYANKRK